VHAGANFEQLIVHSVNVLAGFLFTLDAQASMQTLLALLQQLQLHCSVPCSNENTLCLSAHVLFLQSLQLQIQNDVLEFPADVAMSPGLKRLLSGMMIKDPAKRMRLEQVKDRYFNRYFCKCYFRSCC
jgi:hypothetical protein